jgi:hypothetical protein
VHEHPTGRDREPSTQALLEGDMVVTRVAHLYSLSRMKADRRTQTPIDVRVSRADALSLGCLLAGADHRCFLTT